MRKIVFITGKQFFQTIPVDGQITVFLMPPMSVTYSACFGNVTLGEIRPDMT